MSDRDKNELTATTQDDLARQDAIARVLDKARASGLCPDDHNEKAFMGLCCTIRPSGGFMFVSQWLRVGT